VIIEIAGGPEMSTFIDRLAPNGRMVVVGAVAGMPPAYLGTRLKAAFQQSRSVATFSLDNVPVRSRDKVGAEHSAAAAAAAAAARRELRCVVHDVLTLEQAAGAKEADEPRQRVRRILLIALASSSLHVRQVVKQLRVYAAPVSRTNRPDRVDVATFPVSWADAAGTRV
jgi:NADPH2:quinone reductase